MPIFVQNHPRLRQAWTEKWEQIVANSFEFREVREKAEKRDNKI